MVGTTISDRYRIIELIAMGGMGAIFRGEHLLMRKHVAIKVLHPEIENFPDLVARFEREAVAGAHIQHPNVASASDFGNFGEGSAFLVLEFIEGITLRELLTREGPLAAPRAAGIAKQLAQALGAVHEKGIIHRDVKPLNVMVLKADSGAKDTIKLIDFGLAKVPVDQLSDVARDADPIRRSLTAAGVVMGTVAYIAPEAALGMRSVGPRSDLYSLGVLFYEMLAGKHPFDGEDPKTLFSQHRSKTPPRIAERNPNVRVPPALEVIVQKLLAKDPDARYTDADALVRAIDEALAPPSAIKPAPPPRDLTPIAVSSQASVPRYPAPARSRTIWFALGSMALAGATAAVVWASMKTQGSQPSAVASEAPSASTSAAISTEPSASAAKSSRDTLRMAVDSRDPKRASAALVELLAQEPKSLADSAVQTEAAAAAELVATVEGEAADDIFDRIAKLGANGPDVLYAIVAREPLTVDPAQRVGLTKPKDAAARARALLARPDILNQASPSMRIALDLRRAACVSRPMLFPRAAKDGDDRALQILLAMQPPGCTPQTSSCCFPQHMQLDRTIADIQARLRR